MKSLLIPRTLLKFWPKGLIFLCFNYKIWSIWPKMKGRFFHHLESMRAFEAISKSHSPVPFLLFFLWFFVSFTVETLSWILSHCTPAIYFPCLSCLCKTTFIVKKWTIYDFCYQFYLRLKSTFSLFFGSIAPTQAPSSSSFTLLVPSSAADKDDDADDPIPHLLNRRVGGHGFPPIAINIKSTNLGFLHEAEGETKEREEEQEQEHEMTSSRNPLKRPSDTISSDESEEGESRHSKRSLIDIVDRDHIAAVAATSIKHVDYADKPSVRIELV